MAKPPRNIPQLKLNTLSHCLNQAGGKKKTAKQQCWKTVSHGEGRFSSTLLIYIFFKLLHFVPAKVCEVLTLSQAKWSTFNMNVAFLSFTPPLRQELLLLHVTNQDSRPGLSDSRGCTHHPSFNSSGLWRPRALPRTTLGKSANVVCDSLHPLSQKQTSLYPKAYRTHHSAGTCSSSDSFYLSSSSIFDFFLCFWKQFTLLSPKNGM